MSETQNCKHERQYLVKTQKEIGRVIKDYICGNCLRVEQKIHCYE